MANVNSKPINRLLVANRGEIARRIFRTAKEMGIQTVAVYADGDKDEPFVRESDIAISLNGTTARETYLHVEKILAACESAGVDAVHPGYGFLSENADFASALTDVGITWIGPPVTAIAQMGDKLAAKQIMIEAGVPTLPAVEIAGEGNYESVAEDIGYPVLVKASAGGGGRGMRIVEEPAELAAAIESARREAGAAFGDDTIFLEKWLARSQHIEIQILGDQHGELVYFFERECSIQRRHQKVVEEAPSPTVGSKLRKAMGEAALDAARSIGYSSAGTVEFLVDGDDFWFLEVNTRLQVEHPVTELITGYDLVREQIRLAEGETLGYAQKDLSFSGHAVEVRIYAENPARDFLPSPGNIKVWRPAAGVRTDSGIESGSTVSVNFDSMIAKVISHAPTRSEAVKKLARALEDFEIHGITHNRDFLVSVLRSREFLSGNTTTDFIERVDLARVREVTDRELADTAIAAALFAQNERRKQAKVLSHIQTGWRNSMMPPERASYSFQDRRIDLTYRSLRDGSFSFDIAGTELRCVIHSVGHGQMDLQIDDRRMSYRMTIEETTSYIHSPYGDITLVENPRFTIPGEEELAGSLVSPMPGKILATEVSVGDAVTKGDLLVVMEAMKMEHRIFSPLNGTITDVFVEVGQQVDKDVALVDIEEIEAAA